MTITIGANILDLDGTNVGGGTADAVGDRIVYTWTDANNAGKARFAVYDRDGTQIAAPRDVDAANENEGFAADMSVYGVSENAGGGFTIHYTSNASFSTKGTHFVRDFAADGTPQGAGRASGVDADAFPYNPVNSTSLALSNGNLAVLSEGGLTIFDGTSGARLGGGDSGPRFPGNDTGFELVETGGRILTITGVNEAVLGSGFSLSQTGSISGQYYTLAGAAQGTAFSIDADVTYPTRSYDADNVVAVDVLTDGRIAVAWADADAPGDDDSGGIVATILGANGSVSVAPFLVNADRTETRQGAPELFALSDGDFLIAYATDDQTGNASNFIGYQRVNGDGTLDDTSVVAPQTTFRLEPTNPTNSVIGPNGEGLVISAEGLARSIEIEGLSGGTPPTTPPVTPPSGSGELIEGTAGNDTLTGGAGDDTIRGLDGTDNLIGGGGNDLIEGGATDQDRRDNIFGGAGNDTIDGGYGNDELRGDAGDDVVAGGFGGDTVIGGTGNDSLTGSAFGDLLFGGDGDDFVNGGFGYDQINGGAGADTFFHLGIADHGTDFVQDYNGAEGDVLVSGIAGATADDFQINLAARPRSGEAGVEEAFVIYKPTEQILWALIDGGGQVFDLTA